MQSWADQEVLQLALRSGVSRLILLAAYESVLCQASSFMSNQHLGARLVDPDAASKHKNAARRFGSVSSRYRGRISSLRGFGSVHRTTIISGKSMRGRKVFTVGYLPHVGGKRRTAVLSFGLINSLILHAQCALNEPSAHNRGKSEML